MAPHRTNSEIAWFLIKSKIVHTAQILVIWAIKLPLRALFYQITSVRQFEVLNTKKVIGIFFSNFRKLIVLGLLEKK